MNVSRETRQRLEVFEALVRKWNPAINLVSKASLKELHSRHIADSMQLFGIAGIHAGLWADLGSGGGFPGLVIAAMAAEEAPDVRVTLIESDTRKAAFLMTAARDMGLAVSVLAQRIDAAEPQAAKVISARALAPLVHLLPMAARHLAPGGFALFPKGAGHATEVDEARARWRFSLEEFPSLTDPDARILKLGDISRD